MRDWLTAAAGRLRQEWVPVLEATIAATVAWVVAARVIGHPDPFFAPTAALAVLGEARGRRVRQTDLTELLDRVDDALGLPGA